MDYLPLPLVSPWTYHIFNLQFRRLNSKVVAQHTAAIEKVCVDSNSKPHAPLSYLNARQLLDLWVGDILPLERGYFYFIKESQQDEVVTQVRNNIERLTRLKNHLYSALREVVSTENKALSHDDRLAIYSILKNAGDSDETLSRIVMQIPQRAFASRDTKEAIERDLKEVNQFCNQVVEALDMGSIGENLFILANKENITPSFIRNIRKKAMAKIKETLQQWSGLPFTQYLWRLRYIAYFTLSFGLYHYAIQMLTAVLYFIVSTATLNAISSVLFYTLGLAPLWVIGWSVARQTALHLQDYFLCWKKQEILDSLITLEKSQHFIANTLSHVIIDIVRCDIPALIAKIERAQTDLQQALESLDRFYRFEKTLCKGGVLEQIELVKDKIAAQQQILQTQLENLAAHMTLRVDEEIELLDKDQTEPNKSRLMPVLPIEQLHHIEKFVRTFGNTDTQRQFDSSTNIVDKWLNRMAAGHFCDTAPSSGIEKPWGKYRMQKAYLEGWEPILHTFAKTDAQREAVQKLNALFLAKNSMTKKDFKETVQMLGATDNANVLQKIQTFLCDTLHPAQAENAMLLSKLDKENIRRWYYEREKEINNAEEEVATLFSFKDKGKIAEKLESMDEVTLGRYYALLDGADIFYYASGQIDSLTKRKNIAREYFKFFDGQNSIAYLLLRFLPEGERQDSMERVAINRAQWMLSHTHDSEHLVEKWDSYLFHNADLIGTGRFNFSHAVSVSSDFTVWDESRAEFLSKICPLYGFTSKTLYDQYCEKNQKDIHYNLNQNNRNQEDALRNSHALCI